MSRVVTPSMTPPATGAMKVPHEKIAMRAYEKWCKRGYAHGHDRQDWVEGSVTGLEMKRGWRITPIVRLTPAYAKARLSFGRGSTLNELIGPSRS